jgi:hypothetical protein
VILIFIDDMGFGDVEFNGGTKAKTPHLNQMAKEGRRFHDFYVGCAVCSGSRTALMTGCHYQRLSMNAVLFPNSGNGLHPEEVTLADMLKEAGYKTACVGKWHLGHLPPCLPTKQQFDYFQAYAAFYQSKPEEARAIAMRYADHPVIRWRERFAAAVAQANEIEGDAPQIVSDDNRDQHQAALAAKESALDLQVKGSVVTMTYEHLANVQVNYYEMDLEFLFSTNPFVSSGVGGFSVVQPNKAERIQLADDKRTHSLELPREYQSRNVLVEVIGGGKKRSKAVFSNELQTAVSERFGILTVRHAKDGRALPACYVKIYAMTGSGPQFYKDGYTDLRGKFDYASVSTSDIGSATRFSILIMSKEHGATVLEAPVPQR